MPPPNGNPNTLLLSVALSNLATCELALSRAREAISLLQHPEGPEAGLTATGREPNPPSASTLGSRTGNLTTALDTLTDTQKSQSPARQKKDTAQLVPQQVHEARLQQILKLEEPKASARPPKKRTAEQQAVREERNKRRSARKRARKEAEAADRMDVAQLPLPPPARYGTAANTVPLTMNRMTMRASTAEPALATPKRNPIQELRAWEESVRKIEAQFADPGAQARIGPDFIRGGTEWEKDGVVHEEETQVQSVNDNNTTSSEIKHAPGGDGGPPPQVFHFTSTTVAPHPFRFEGYHFSTQATGQTLDEPAGQKLDKPDDLEEGEIKEEEDHENQVKDIVNRLAEIPCDFGHSHAHPTIPRPSLPAPEPRVSSPPQLLELPPPPPRELPLPPPRELPPLPPVELPPRPLQRAWSQPPPSLPPRLPPTGPSGKENARFAKGSATYNDGERVGASAPALGAENKGRLLLTKMGWIAGTGLGAANNQGILSPLAPVVKTTKSGLR